MIEGDTGVFFRQQTPGALADAVRSFDPDAIETHACRANAERFDVAVFREKLLRFIGERMRERLDSPT